MCREKILINGQKCYLYIFSLCESLPWFSFVMFIPLSINKIHKTELNQLIWVTDAWIMLIYCKCVERVHCAVNIGFWSVNKKKCSGGKLTSSISINGSLFALLFPYYTYIRCSESHWCCRLIWALYWNFHVIRFPCVVYEANVSLPMSNEPLVQLVSGQCVKPRETANKCFPSFPYTLYHAPTGQNLTKPVFQRLM